MFSDFIKTKFAIDYQNKILAIDNHNILKSNDCLSAFEEAGFIIVDYVDVEAFRFLYETKMKYSNQKYLVIISCDLYLPYDIRQAFYCIDISMGNLFPKLNTYVLNEHKHIDLDLLYIANENLYRNISSESDTKAFLEKDIYSTGNIEEYIQLLKDKITDRLIGITGYKSWIDIALYKAKIDYMLGRSGSSINIDEINNRISVCFIKDESRSLGIGIQVQVPNRL